MFDRSVKSIEKYILRFLLVMILIFVLFQMAILVEEFVHVVVNYNFDLNVMERFPFTNVGIIFFDILIALELMETIKPSANTAADKAKLIILIGLIAVTRKLIAIDIKSVEYTTDIALAVLIISLTVGYFLLSGKFKKE